MFEVVNRTRFVDAPIRGLARDEGARPTVLLHLTGGERVRLGHVSAGGPVLFARPRVKVRVAVQIDATADASVPKLDLGGGA